jgi:Rrf2 family protein
MVAPISASVHYGLGPMLTMKTKYALKALAQLARAEQGSPVQIADIAEQEGIPRKFLEAILAELRHHGFLLSRKGRSGGYLLARSPANITLAAVIRVLDGPIAPVPCLSRTAYRRCDGCKDESTCAVRLILRDSYDASLQVLENTTLADMVAKVEHASRGPILRYSI